MRFEQCDEKDLDSEDDEFVTDLIVSVSSVTPLPWEAGKGIAYTVARAVPERHERLLLVISTNEPFRNEFPGVNAPVLWRGM